MDIKEIMENGLMYTDYGPGKEHLEKERQACQELLYDYNMTRPSEGKKRGEILKKLLGDVGEGCWIEPTFKCAYGYRVHIGNYFYANFNAVFVDDVDIYIGDHVMLGPNVTISATGHPVCKELRDSGVQFSVPVHIENSVWIGSGAVIMPGVTIGEGSVIGAGSVVTRDIPAGVIAAGVPCKVMREITEKDLEFYYKNRRVDECPEWAYRD